MEVLGMSTKHFKTCNKIICVGFDKASANYIMHNIHDGLKIIHVFIRDAKLIDIEELLKVSKFCIENKIVLVLRCFDTKVKLDIKKILKGVHKGKYFRVASNCSTKNYLYSYSNGHYLRIRWSDYTSLGYNSVIEVTHINYL